jgi:hypothetical protein
MNNLIKIILTHLIFFLKKIKKYSISKISMILANILILYSRKFYNQYTFLEDAEIKIFSQNGEDGIIDYILEISNIKNPKFIEIGVEDYIESNTRLLYHIRDSHGLIVDQTIDIDKLSKNLDVWKGRIIVIKKAVGPNNINEIVAAIKYFLDNPDIAQQMGENGRRIVKEKYNWKFEEMKLINLYKSL